MDPKLRKLIKAVTAKRPKTVLDHIVRHGQITTEELKTLYGYNHPPRAARDVRECGITLETFRVKGPDGRQIAAYRLGVIGNLESGKVGGRQAFPKKLKDGLIATAGEFCALCGGRFPGRALQVDHRVPYEVAGEAASAAASAFMLVCGSCNRAKSWSCEQCSNWLTTKNASICRTCFWGSPESYRHIATVQRRTLHLQWEGDEVKDHDRLAAEAGKLRVPAAEFAKAVITRALTRGSTK